jgi:hypothetical protein
MQEMPWKPPRGGRLQDLPWHGHLQAGAMTGPARRYQGIIIDVRGKGMEGGT